MQKNKLNLRICGIHLLNPYKIVVSHLKRRFKIHFFDHIDREQLERGLSQNFPLQYTEHNTIHRTARCNTLSALFGLGAISDLKPGFVVFPG